MSNSMTTEFNELAVLNDQALAAAAGGNLQNYHPDHIVMSPSISWFASTWPANLLGDDGPGGGSQ